MHPAVIRDRADRWRPHRNDGAGALYAALDLGTNNCRLLLATAAPDGFNVVECFSRTTRLGEGLAGSGRLCDTAIARTLDALRQCAVRLERRGATHIRAVATEACRRAGNCDDFLEQVRRETGIRLEIISAEEEARLALAGCAPLLDRGLPHGLVFDIGGGSTEILLASLCAQSGRAAMEAMLSLPIGVVTLAEEEGERLHCPEGYEAAVRMVESRLRGFDAQGALLAKAAAGALQMLGTSGTVTTLAGVHLGLPRYDRRRVDGMVMDFPALAAVSRRLLSASPAQRAAHPCIGEGRADLVMAGCAILEAICRLWPVGRLKVADRGVREGLLMAMIEASRARPARH